MAPNIFWRLNEVSEWPKRVREAAYKTPLWCKIRCSYQKRRIVTITFFDRS